MAERRAKEKKPVIKRAADDYANLPYTVTVEPQDDGQGIYYVARVVELPDLFMTGATREEALSELEKAKQDVQDSAFLAEPYQKSKLIK